MNVLDYIVYDMRSEKMVYYVQVSKSPYDAKKKKPKRILKTRLKKAVGTYLMIQLKTFMLKAAWKRIGSIYTQLVI